MDRYTSHETFWTNLTLCTHHCGSRCRSVCLTKSLMRVSSHVRAFVVCSCFVFFLSLSRLYFLSHCLLVLCPAHQLPCRGNLRGLKPLHSRTMRSVAPWRYTTLSHEDAEFRRDTRGSVHLSPRGRPLVIGPEGQSEFCLNGWDSALRSSVWKLLTQCEVSSTWKWCTSASQEVTWRRVLQDTSRGWPR